MKRLDCTVEIVPKVGGCHCHRPAVGPGPGAAADWPVSRLSLASCAADHTPDATLKSGPIWRSAPNRSQRGARMQRLRNPGALDARAKVPDFAALIRATWTVVGWAKAL